MSRSERLALGFILSGVATERLIDSDPEGAIGIALHLAAWAVCFALAIYLTFTAMLRRTK